MQRSPRPPPVVGTPPRPAVEIYDETFWAPSQPQCGMAVAHSGRWAGFVTDALYLPDKKTALAMTVNGDS